MVTASAAARRRLAAPAARVLVRPVYHHHHHPHPHPDRRPRLHLRHHPHLPLTRAASTAASYQLKPQPTLTSKSTLVRRIALACALFLVGSIMAAPTAVLHANEAIHPPSDADTLDMFVPASDEEREVEAFIDSHPVVAELRCRPGFTASRPHLKMPEFARRHSLTGSLLLGPGRIVVPPLVFVEEGGKSLVSISYLGPDVCGHPGIVHGGLLATMLDEGLARCCFPALPHKVGMTANLNINYRAPTPAGSYVVLRATTTKVEGRKAWVEGRIETLVLDGESPVVLAEATALFVSPKHAAMMAPVNPVS